MESFHEMLTAEAYRIKVSGPGPVLVDFSATWCEPCGLLDEILTELSGRLPALAILKLDADEQPELMAHFGFRSVPWLLLYNNGEEIWRMHGFMMVPELEQLIKERCGNL